MVALKSDMLHMSVMLLSNSKKTDRPEGCHRRDVNSQHEHAELHMILMKALCRSKWRTEQTNTYKSKMSVCFSRCPHIVFMCKCRKWQRESAAKFWRGYQVQHIPWNANTIDYWHYFTDSTENIKWKENREILWRIQEKLLLIRVKHQKSGEDINCFCLALY